MKVLMVALPTVMVAGLAVVLANQPAARPLSGDAFRLVEKVRLEQEQQAISGRLEELEAKTHHVVPRGGL